MRRARAKQKTISGGASAPSTVRFGDFELDLRAAELCKNGRRVRLQEQPFQILVELLACPGQVVLREEIRERLWPNNTVVEFDHSINAAVKRLRDALQDSAGKPRYVETLARRGYRFVALVSRVNGKSSEPGAAVSVRRKSTRVERAVDPQQHELASVAVLPFTNLSRDSDGEYFSDGLSEELINELAHVPGLKVAARTSAFAFRGKQRDIRSIARALGVTNIVEGGVRRAGARVRITAQLIAAKDGTHLWSERYDREMVDIFAVQDDIARAIATALRVHLAGTLRRYVPALPAYEAYLKARHCLAAFTRESLPRSREFFEQALASDQGFAAAYSGLAMALASLPLPGITAAQIAMPLARDAATKALHIDPVSQEAQAVLGMVAALYDFNWSEAQRRFQLAMAHEPTAPYVLWYYSFSYLVPMGRAQESVQECMRGMDSDPLNFMGGFHYAGALLAAGKADAGEAHLRQLCELYPNLYQPHYLLALSGAVRGSYEEALTAAAKAYSLAPWSTTTKGLLGGILHRTGEAIRADELHNELLCMNQYGAAMGLLLFHLASSGTEGTASWAEKAVEQRDPRMILLLALIRAFQPNTLRSDGWTAIVRTLRIPLLVSVD